MRLQRCLNQCKRLEHRKTKAAEQVTNTAKSLAIAQKAADEARSHLRQVALELVQANADRDFSASELQQKPSEPPSRQPIEVLEEIMRAARDAAVGTFYGTDYEACYKAYTDSADNVEKSGPFEGRHMPFNAWTSATILTNLQKFSLANLRAKASHSLDSDAAEVKAETGQPPSKKNRVDQKEADAFAQAAIDAALEAAVGEATDDSEMSERPPGLAADNTVGTCQ